MANNPISGSRPTVRPAVPARSTKKGRPGRLTGSLIGMSSAAIISVYAAGYLNTQAAGGQVGNQADSAATAGATTGGSAMVAPSVGQQTSGTTVDSSSGQTAKSAAASQSGQYKDGTYTGIGSSRHGSIQATVVVRGGSIVSANVTGCGTRYPCSKVTSLVSQVVSRQSAPVNYVSGATDSSTAYAQAVKSALAQAASA